MKEFLNVLDQYADDADIFSIYNKKSYDSIFQCLENFRNMSGFTLNYDKTSIFRIGSIKNTDAMLISQRAVSWTNEPVNFLGIWISNNMEETMRLNYQPLIDKAKLLLSDWTKRNLSLLGKVTIINTLVASLYVYRMTVLPKMSEAMLSQVNNTMVKFLWSGARPKIAYTTLTLPKAMGGLNLCDIARKDKSIKVGWVQILKKDEKLANIVYCNVCDELGDKVWNCNLEYKDIPILTNDPFWSDVFGSWYDYKRKVDKLSTPNEEIIWYNSKIRIGGKPFIWKDCAKKGLIYVNQLYKNRTTISVRSAASEYGLGMMQYNSLVSALPREFKKFFQNQKEYIEQKHHFYELSCVRANLTSHAYSAFAEDTGRIAEKSRKWENVFGSSFDTQEYLSCLKEIYCTTNIPKYRSFQYRLMQRALITNVQLHRWNKKDDDSCSFCGEEPESYPHLFILCKLIQPMWVQIEQFMMQFDSTEIRFDVASVICNRIVSKSRNVKNFICLLFKQYLYRQRCLSKEPKISEFKQIVWRTERIEKYIAEKNNKLEKHRKKWHSARP